MTRPEHDPAPSSAPPSSAFDDDAVEMDSVFRLAQHPTPRGDSVQVTPEMVFHPLLEPGDTTAIVHLLFIAPPRGNTFTVDGLADSLISQGLMADDVTPVNRTHAEAMVGRLIAAGKAAPRPGEPGVYDFRAEGGLGAGR